MNLFEIICNDKEIIDRYHEVEKYEEKSKRWAYHNFSHVYNVCEIVEKILTNLNYDKKFIESAKVAAILHDTGANDEKEGHAYRGYLFTKDYFERKNIDIDYKEEILEAIKIHSDGFDTANIIALSIILADKLDVKGNRITKVGKTIVGNRQYQYVEDIDIKIVDNELIINFLVSEEFNRIESEEYYFTKKIFNAIKAFASKFNLEPKVLLNNYLWDNFYIENENKKETKLFL